jgi:uncharacterized protein
MPEEKREKSYKPFDFGNGLIAGSLNSAGRFIAINTYHPEHGYVTLSSVPPFADSERYNPAAVRRYRAQLADPSLPGFGFSFLHLTDNGGSRNSFRAEHRLKGETDEPVMTGNTATLFRDTTKLLPAPIVVQTNGLTNGRQFPERFAFEFGGKFSLTRAAYTQLTEGGVISHPSDDYNVYEDGEFLVIENRSFNCAVAIAVGSSEFEKSFSTKLMLYGGWDFWVEDSQINIRLRDTKLEVDREWKNSLPLPFLTALIAFGSNGDEATKLLRDYIPSFVSYEVAFPVNAIIDSLTSLIYQYLKESDARWHIEQALTYILACCAVPTDDEAYCLLTDHQLLPLAWTRDTYYQARALLTMRKMEIELSKGEIKLELGLRYPHLTLAYLEKILRGHLIWLFERAERPDGYWGRSYLANGRQKDPIFQLDQQCYPLLELADYVLETGDRALAERFYPIVNEIWQMILARKADSAWLFPTGETPADDKVEMPYHFSSQLVVWHTLRQLAKLNMPGAADFLSAAENIRQDILRQMVATEPTTGKPVFAYLTDLAGNYRFYHDANDWPTVLAAEWGFCPPDDPVWRATLDFAFSPVNREGYFPGRYGGLGSVHTPHAWPLGDFQELYLARYLGDKEKMARIWDKIEQIATEDGMFPEAYDENTGAVVSRHWFGWPGAMLVIALCG